MTLSFSTTWPDRMGGGPTHFVEKIWAGLPDPMPGQEKYFDGEPWKPSTMEKKYPEWEGAAGMAPKIHTIREDKHDSWKVGMKIHPVICNRSPNRFQFAPTLVCTGVQEIEIKYVDMPMRSKYVICFDDKQAVINMHGRSLMEEEAQKLAINDGFDSIEHFFQWFNEPFVGKLIHWTDFKY